MENSEQILSCILDAGEMLLTSGAEVSRVEDTMSRMAVAYGFERADVLTITASVIVTARRRPRAKGRLPARSAACRYRVG